MKNELTFCGGRIEGRPTFRRARSWAARVSRIHGCQGWEIVGIHTRVGRASRSTPRYISRTAYGVLNYGSTAQACGVSPSPFYRSFLKNWISRLKLSPESEA
jgi:hypothetical protein